MHQSFQWLSLIKTKIKGDGSSQAPGVLIWHQSENADKNGKRGYVAATLKLFANHFGVYNEIDTEIELTDTGIKVIQTSANPEVVTLLQTHAAEVSDMSKRGMQAVHERMAGQSHQN